MSEPLSTESYKGVRDFYPADWAKLQTLFASMRRTLTRAGYEEYNASPLERAELYEAKTSEEIVNEQTYTFMDRGDRRVTLRPEMTPTLARMVAAKRRELAFPLRWFSIPNVFRYERPQRGRLREHYQLNVDLLGLPEGVADVEVVRTAAQILLDLGATSSDFSILINSRSLLNAACDAAGLTGDARKAYIRLLDRKAKMTADAFAAAVRELGPIDPLSLIENDSSDGAVTTEKKKLIDFVESLHAQGVTNAVVDTSVTRGFDYYTGFVFEVFDTNPENARSLFGGGRYDKLVALFGSEPVPAVGFGMGDVTLLDFLETHGIAIAANSRPQLYIGTPSPADVTAAEAFADTLRKQGCRIFVNLTDKSLGDQIKDAVRREIPLFLAYGAQEAVSSTVRLKILATSEETAIPVTDLPSRLQSGS